MKSKQEEVLTQEVQQEEQMTEDAVSEVEQTEETQVQETTAAMEVEEVETEGIGQGPSTEEPPAPAEQEEPAVVEEEEERLPPALRLIRQRLARYVESMRPGLPMRPGECAGHQLSLYRAIMSILGLSGQDFIVGMGMLVQVVRDNRRGVFSERYIARDFENLQLAMNNRLFFERVIRLLLVTADMRNRVDVGRHVDIAAVIKYLPDGNMQQRLLEYYDVE